MPGGLTGVRSNAGELFSRGKRTIHVSVICVFLDNLHLYATMGIENSTFSENVRAIVTTFNIMQMNKCARKVWLLMCGTVLSLFKDIMFVSAFCQITKLNTHINNPLY